MQAIEFPQQHTILAKDQPEYIPLPVHLNSEPFEANLPDGTKVTGQRINKMTACFKLDPEEITQIIATGMIWYTQVVGSLVVGGEVVNGRQFQPIRMSVVNPFTNITTLPDNWLKEMCDRIKDVVQSLAFTDEGKQEILAFIADQFAAWRECCAIQVKGGFTVPKGVNPIDHLKKCDGNAKR